MFKSVLRNHLLHEHFLSSLKNKLKSFILRSNDTLLTRSPKTSGEKANAKRNALFKDTGNFTCTFSKPLQSEPPDRTLCRLQVADNSGFQFTASPVSGTQIYSNQRLSNDATTSAKKATTAMVPGQVGTRSLLCLASPLILKSQISRISYTSKAWTTSDRPWDQCIGRGAVRRPQTKQVAKPPPAPPPPCNPRRNPCKTDPDAFMEVLCKRAIVTGGATGVGLAACYQLLHEGADGVLIADCNEKAGQRAARALNSRYGPDKALFAKADVSRMSDFECVFKAARKNFESLDILVNNAGVFDERTWQNAVNTNIKSVMCGCCLAMKYMSEEHGGKGGVVVNLGAAAALDTIAAFPIFCATKRAVLAFTEGFGHDARYETSKVRVVSLCPGFTKTPYHLLTSSGCLADPAWAAEAKKQVGRLTAQPASAVGCAVAYVVRYGCPAKHYVVEGSVISEMALPSRKEIGKHIATIL